MVATFFSVSILLAFRNPENPHYQRIPPFRKMPTRRINRRSVGISSHCVGSMRKAARKSKTRNEGISIALLSQSVDCYYEPALPVTYGLRMGIR